MEMAQIAARPGRVSRWPYDEDRRGRDLSWPGARRRCSIRVDAMGNIFARRAGGMTTCPGADRLPR